MNNLRIVLEEDCIKQTDNENRFTPTFMNSGVLVSPFIKSNCFKFISRPNALAVSNTDLHGADPGV